MIFIPVQVNISEFRVNNEKKIRIAFLLRVVWRREAKRS